MKLDRNQAEESYQAESADRRQFLRNAMRIGGAAALLLTSASREMLAKSLTLSSSDLDAARRAGQAPAGPANPDRDSGTMEAGYARSSGTCDGCSGSCQGECKGCSGACSANCSGTCAGGCHSSCQGDCKGGCASGCTGCKGTA